MLLERRMPKKVEKYPVGVLTIDKNSAIIIYVSKLDLNVDRK
jgi:hypothetical protein